MWETYKSDKEVFLPNGTKPKPWNNPPPPPHCATTSADVRAILAKPGVRVLSALSAFGDFVLDSTNQASGQWLADQAGNLIYYDIRMNEDEFDSIVKSRFYNGAVQNQTAATGVNPTPGGDYQVKLPAGCNPGSCPNKGPARTGAIELKAAWRILTNPSQYKRYLTTKAVLIDSSGTCSSATMGLVGLHIIHKTVTQPQFVWATFEHVDNVPPASHPTFNNAGCTCQTAVSQSCGASKTPFENCTADRTEGEACDANIPPPISPPSESCPAFPVQVTRRRPISDNSSDPVEATNVAAKALLTTANPKTVFQYYQLVDVLWSGSPQNNYTNQPGQPGPVTPLSMSGATPDASALPVANTTMETYVQGKTCLSCHVFATVPAGNYASDFSFIMGEAQSPAARVTAAAKTPAPRPRRHLPAGLVRFNYSSTHSTGTLTHDP